MSTTPVESWAVELADIGPIYPFVGSEVITGSRAVCHLDSLARLADI